MICSFFILEETHAPVITGKQLASIRQSDTEPTIDETTPLNPDIASRRPGLETETTETNTTSGLAQAFERPLKLLFLSPVCASCSVAIALTAGTTNLIFASLGRIFQEQYGFSTSASGLVYLGVTTGFLLAAFVFGGTSDHISRLLAQRNHGKIEPEFRLPAMFVGLPLIVVGLLWYGWTAMNRVFWTVPTLGLNIVGLGITTVQVSSRSAKCYEIADEVPALVADVCGRFLRRIICIGACCHNGDQISRRCSGSTRWSDVVPKYGSWMGQ